MTRNKDLTWYHVSEYYSGDRSKKAVVCHDIAACCYFVDFYDCDIYIDTVAYPGKSIHYAEDAAENYTLGILEL